LKLVFLNKTASKKYQFVEEKYQFPKKEISQGGRKIPVWKS